MTPHKNYSKLKLFLLITFILFLSAFFRFLNINWDENHHLHPDERFLTMVGTKIRMPSKISLYFNNRLSPLNPYRQGFSFFVYGTLPLFLVKALAVIFHQDNYQRFNLLGRAVSAAFDLGTLFLVGLIGKRTIKKYWPIALFVYGISVLPIQLSHFFAVDTFLNFFLTASLFFLILFEQKRQRKALVLSALFLGMALACKISALLFFFPAILFVGAKNNLLKASSWKKRRIFSFLGENFIFLAFSFFSWRLFQPYVFRGIQFNPQFIANLKELQSYNHPRAFFPPAIQWIKTSPLIFPLKNIIFWGLGLPLGLTAIISFFLFPYFFKKKKEKFRPLIFCWLWVLLVFFFQGLQFAKPMRYFLPLYPSLALIIGASLGAFWEKAKKKKFFFTASLCWVLAVLIWPISFIRIYLHPHSRIQASAWIYQHIPSHATLSCEYWDDCLPLSLKNENALSYRYQTEMLHLFDRESPQKWAKINRQLKKIDYLILSSNRLWGSIPKVPEIYPQTAAFYQNLFAEKLNFKKVAEITSYPCFPPLGKPFFCFPDQSADESFTVYDHPKVIIFQKNNNQN